MTTNVANRSPYLRTSRMFPDDSPQALSVEITKSYIDIANIVNQRTIGNYSTVQSVTGNTWYIQGGTFKQQTFRKAFTFTTTAAIAHAITNVMPGDYINCYGSYTDGTDNFGLFFGSSVAIAGQITFYVTATQIIFLVGAGAPALSSGKIVLEWLTNV